MSNKRSSSMATIEAQLGVAQMKAAKSPDEAVDIFFNGPKEATTAPGTAPEKEKVTTKSKVGDETFEHSRIRNIPGQAGSLINGFYGGVSKATARVLRQIGSFPTPGGLLTPLVILFILFMILLPVNGHTRLMWLWLAITGNAEIGPPLTPPTLLSPSSTTTSPTGTSGGFSYNTGSPKVNPNQTGTVKLQSAAANSSKNANNATTHKLSVVSQTNKSVTAVKQRATIKSNVSHKGSGPGPANPQFVDPTSPIQQISYSLLMSKINGYE